MVIEIKKHADGYTAFVVQHHNDVEWATAEPMGEQDLRKKLYDLGCHPIDITEAILATDPERRRKFRESIRADLIEAVGEQRAVELDQRIKDQRNEALRKHAERALLPIDEQISAYQQTADLIEERRGPEAAQKFLKQIKDSLDYKARTGMTRSEERTAAFRKRLREENPDHPHGA